jgi:hypothetical protein
LDDRRPVTVAEGAMENQRNRLRRLLLLLLGALDRQREGLELHADEVMTLLEGAGYAEADLDDLWRWLQARGAAAADEPAWLSSQLCGRASPCTLRQMGTREDEVVTVPAFGYLLELVRSGQISAEQMESLLQFAQLVPGGPLATGDLAPLLERVIVSDRDGWAVGGVGASERAH